VCFVVVREAEVVMRGAVSSVLFVTSIAVGCGSGSDNMQSPQHGAIVGQPVVGNPTPGASSGSGGTSSGFGNANMNGAAAAGSDGFQNAPKGGAGGGPSMLPSGTAGMTAATGGAPAIGTGGSSAAPTAPGCRPNAPCSNGTEPVIPEPMGECPPMVSGPFTFMGVTSQIWVGTKSDTQKGPIMLYWHGTGGNALTATGELDAGCVAEIMAQGGVIGSIEGGLMGDTLDWGVFTTGDYQSADQIVACAVQQLNIDTHRIYSAGASAGGLAAGEIAYGRSQYIAATNPNSGGQGGYPMNMVLSDPTHVPAALTMHGARGVDVVVIDFGDSSLREDIDIAKKGGFAVDCDHGGPHVGAPLDLKAAGWDFLKAHPFGFGTSPYAGGLPASYPSYCMIVTKDTQMPMSMMP
jgi:hypothetical protein